MFSVSYLQMVLLISIIWLVLRALCWFRNKCIDLKREATLLFVYICILVAVRFTFCPFGKVNGKVQPLLFDPDRILPFWVNFTPFVHLFDYASMRDALLNLFGNIAMFIPMGFIWPTVFQALDRPVKAIAAGVGLSLVIEILQLPFFDRATDIDDLLLNSAGFLLGYGIYFMVQKIRSKQV